MFHYETKNLIIQETPQLLVLHWSDLSLDFPSGTLTQIGFRAKLGPSSAHEIYFQYSNDHFRCLICHGIFNWLKLDGLMRKKHHFNEA